MQRPKNRIGPRRPRRIYMAEWRDYRGLTQKQLGARFDPPVADMTISRWERAAAAGRRLPNTAFMSTDVLAAVAEALDCEPQDLYRHPAQPSADELLRNASPEEQARAVAIVRAALAKLAS